MRHRAHWPLEEKGMTEPMAKTIERLFISAQISLLGGGVLALALGDGGLCDALLPLSLFFGGAALGASMCGRFHGKEVIR